MPEQDEVPPVDTAVVGTAAAMDPSGTTLIATLAAGAVGVVIGAGRRVVRVVRPGRSGRPDGGRGSSGARRSGDV